MSKFVQKNGPNLVLQKYCINAPDNKLQYNRKINENGSNWGYCNNKSYVRNH